MTGPAAKTRHRPVIRVFVSSTFTDFKHERDTLQQEVYPRLERLCMARRFQFHAIDLRWGVSTEAALDHRTMRICFEELRCSQQVSPRPNFILLLGNRYGWRPLPEEICKVEFQQLATHAATPEESGVLAHWYRRDDNARPPVYILRSRQITLRDGTIETVADDEWNGIQAILWKIINAAYPPADLAGRFAHDVALDAPLPAIVRFQASATEQEIWRGGLCIPDAPAHVRAFTREIDNLDEFAHNPQVGSFRDTDSNGAADPGPQSALADLKWELSRRLGPDAIISAGTARLRQHADADGRAALDITTDHLQELCDKVYAALEPIIIRQMDEYWQDAAPGEASPQELQRERQEHERFGEERAPADAFVGREDLLSAIHAYLHNDSRHPLVVHGFEGQRLLAQVTLAQFEGRRSKKDETFPGFQWARPGMTFTRANGFGPAPQDATCFSISSKVTTNLWSGIYTSWAWKAYDGRYYRVRSQRRRTSRLVGDWGCKAQLNEAYRSRQLKRTNASPSCASAGGAAGDALAGLMITRAWHCTAQEAA